MKIAIVSQVTHPSVTRSVLETIANALNRQQIEHFSGYWQSMPVPVDVVDGLADVPPTDNETCPLYVRHKPHEAGILGDHDISFGRPYLEVFLDPILGSGGDIMKTANSLSATMSHEVLEAAADAYANYWADGPHGIEHALETCDIVEAFAYEIDDVQVSNFLTSRYFEPGGKGRFDYLGLLSHPFQAPLPGGYEIIRSASPDARNITARAHSVSGGHPQHFVHRAHNGRIVAAHFTPEMPAWKVATKVKKAVRRGLGDGGLDRCRG